jgi:peptidoglycan hydrolase FlgJ
MDLIADVMKQADPAAARRALLRLQHLSGASPERDVASTFRARPKDQSRLDPQGLDAAADPKSAAMQKLETVLATKMVEAMLPKDQSRLYGEGTAGDVWRGFHIEAMGKAIAEEGLLSTRRESPAAEQQPSGRKAITPFSG